MEWLLRYSEFLSPDQINSVIYSFKEVYQSSTNMVKDDFINHLHNSEAIPTSLQMMRNIRKKRATREMDEDAFDQNMSIIIGIFEPLLINDHNMETLIRLDGV